MDHEGFCLIVENEKSTREVVELTAALTFLLEDIKGEPVNLEMECLKKLLTTYFEFEDVKEDLPENVLERILLPIEKIYEDTVIPIRDNLLKRAVIIDLYAGRDCYCGCNLEKLYKKHFPEGEQMEEIRRILMEEGVEG